MVIMVSFIFCVLAIWCSKCGQFTLAPDDDNCELRHNEAEYCFIVLAHLIVTWVYYRVHAVQ